jgi:tRNA (mo5U34)-methyltransferase
MDLRVTLAQTIAELIEARSDEDRNAAGAAAMDAIRAFAQEAPSAPPEGTDALARSASRRLAGSTVPVSTMSDEQIAEMNRLLPWGAMTVDPTGRVVGNPWSSTKRNVPHDLIDHRQQAFAEAFPLTDRHVLEIGCFEGIHSLGLKLLGAKVTGVDSRVANILKTLSRLWLYGHTADVVLWDVEKPPTEAVPQEWDVLHHVGVLYHLTNPVEHLLEVLPRTRHAVLLDTHVADDAASAKLSYEVNGASFSYRRKPEPLAAHSPFAGMKDHAKYLLIDDIVELFRQSGFTDVRLVEDRAERNGRRVTVWAFR